MMLPATSVLQEQSVVLEAQREAQASRVAAIQQLVQRELERSDQDEALEAQRLRREAQIAEDRERDCEMEDQRIHRNLQIAQYCGCNKCQVSLVQSKDLQLCYRKL